MIYHILSLDKDSIIYKFISQDLLVIKQIGGGFADFDRDWFLAFKEIDIITWLYPY